MLAVEGLVDKYVCHKIKQNTYNQPHVILADWCGKAWDKNLFKDFHINSVPLILNSKQKLYFW